MDWQMEIRGTPLKQHAAKDNKNKPDQSFSLGKEGNRHWKWMTTKLQNKKNMDWFIDSHKCIQSSGNSLNLNSSNWCRNELTNQNTVCSVMAGVELSAQHKCVHTHPHIHTQSLVNDLYWGASWRQSMVSSFQTLKSNLEVCAIWAEACGIFHLHHLNNYSM